MFFRLCNKEKKKQQNIEIMMGKEIYEQNLGFFSQIKQYLSFEMFERVKCCKEYGKID